MFDVELELAESVLNRYLEAADRVHRLDGALTTVGIIPQGLYDTIVACSKNLQEMRNRKQWDYL